MFLSAKEIFQNTICKSLSSKYPIVIVNVSLYRGSEAVIGVIYFVLLLFLVYLIVSSLIVNRRAEKYKKRANNLSLTKDISFQEKFFKIDFLKTKDDFLSKQGYPLKLNAISYYILKGFLTVLLFIAGISNYHSLIMAIILGIIGFAFLDVYILANKKNRDSEICVDLLNVIDSISLQLSAEVSLKDSLKRQFENCRNKDFKKAILEFSMQYELSELNISEALNNLKNKFDILELNMFCNSLKEYNKVGNIIDILDNLSETLKVKYIEKIKDTTRTKVLYITLGVIIALGNIIMLTFYPLFISIGQGFRNIFN